jgi:dihydroxy-acid dehydratase
MSGSTNSIKHLQAIATEAKTGIDVSDMFDRFSSDVPLIVGIRPNGKHHVDDLDAAGGAQAIMKSLESILKVDAMTVNGKTLRENLASAEIKNKEVVRPIDNAFNNRPGIFLLKGNLATSYGIAKLQIDDSYKPNYFKGPAKVFTDGATAAKALKEGNIVKGDVVVVCGIGVTGVPGQGSPGGIVFGLDAMGLGSDVAIVTDGHSSGLVNLSLMVVDVEPEAARGGAIGLVKDGDIITIDVLNRVLHADVSDEEFEERRKTAPDYVQKGEEGWLKLFQERVKPLNEGALIK